MARLRPAGAQHAALLLLCFYSLAAALDLASLGSGFQTLEDIAASAAALAQMGANLQASMPEIAQAIARTDLPVLRPPPHGKDGSWAFCNFSCIANVNNTKQPVVRMASAETGGVFMLDVRLKPIAGVKARHAVWLFANLHKPARCPWSTSSGTMPMYLIFHPVDHMRHTATGLVGGKVVPGTRFIWTEMPLTGCTYQRDSATEPWVCPAKRTGFTRADPEARYASLMHTKMSGLMASVVTQSNASMVEFTNSITLAPGISRVVGTTRHTWENNSAGLKWRVQQWIGLMKAGNNTRFETGAVANLVNPIIRSSYLDGASNLGGNITAAAWMGALHFAQEYGSLGLWLPQVYGDANPRTA